ncbi:MAG: hypothetical protein V2A61_04910 [Calditrichota bacterium]
MNAPDERTQILVIDDHPDTLEILNRNLQKRGYTVYSASGATEVRAGFFLTANK